MAELVPFDVTTPIDAETAARHIAHARSLGLRLALSIRAPLAIVTGGPGALDAPFGDAPTLALNNALRLFTERGKAPTFYACQDPQELVAGFLTDPPKETTYYVASKCHPAVFAALRDRDVRLYDTDDYVPGGIAVAPSITLMALNLFTALGWRDFDIWGWNCCEVGGAHHATDQAAPAGIQTAMIGDRPFRTTTTWLYEAQSAAQILPILEYVGVTVNIRGESLIPHARRALTPRAA